VCVRDHTVILVLPLTSSRKGRLGLTASAAVTLCILAVLHFFTSEGMEG
jgi:hypothetical protein